MLGIKIAKPLHTWIALLSIIGWWEYPPGWFKTEQTATSAKFSLQFGAVEYVIQAYMISGC